jgi:hypothetical protein
MNSSPADRGRRVAVAIFTVWAIATAVPLGVLMATHLAGIAPADARGSRWPVSGPGWHVVHVSASGCPCSSAVLAHLAERGPLTGVREYVWVTGERRTPLPALKGFEVSAHDGETLAARGVTAAPWLVVVAPDGSVAYSGGYRRRSSSREWDDVAIVGEAQRGRDVAVRPVFGCATGASIARAQDPVGVKWLRRWM